MTVRGTLLLLALVGALAAVPGAFGLNVQIKDGDTVDVVGTKMACFYLPSKTLPAIRCNLANNKGLMAGTYGIAISQRGDVVVTRVKKNGSQVTLWGNRKKSSARRQAIRYLELRKGDSFGFKLNNIDIGCTILDLKAKTPRYTGRRVVCFRSIKGTPIAGSYGVIMSDKFAGSFRFDAKGNPGKNSFVGFQP